MNSCPIEEILDLVGDRWSLLLVGALASGPRRTTELITDLAGVSTRTLADRLKRLETAGILTRKSYPESPPRVEYQLTERGSELRTVLAALRATASTWHMPRCGNPECPQCSVDLAARMDGERVERAEHPVRARPSTIDVTLL